VKSRSVRATFWGLTFSVFYIYLTWTLNISVVWYLQSSAPLNGVNLTSGSEPGAAPLPGHSATPNSSSSYFPLSFESFFQSVTFRKAAYRWQETSAYQARMFGERRKLSRPEQFCRQSRSFLTARRDEIFDSLRGETECLGTGFFPPSSDSVN
jgi:hypothetical protein